MKKYITVVELNKLRCFGVLEILTSMGNSVSYNLPTSIRYVITENNQQTYKLFGLLVGDIKTSLGNQNEDLFG